VAVPGDPGQSVATTFTLTGTDTDFSDEVGLFLVDDADGRIGTLRPGDAGYAAAALAAPRRAATFAPLQRPVAASSLELPAGPFLGLYLAQTTTAEAVLAGNPTNDLGSRPFAFFSFRSANPDRTEHVHALPGGQYAFEDLFAGGDRHFNDRVVQIEFSPTS